MFATGSLIRTLIPRRRARKWTSVVSLNDSGSTDASGNNTAPTTRAVINIAGPDVFIEPSRYRQINPTDHDVDVQTQSHSTCTSTSLLPSQRLPWEVHAVCFTCSDVAAPMATVKSVLAGAFAGVKLHEYPYGAETWPANLIVNMRDAAIVTEQFPEVYKPDDVLLFTSIAPSEASAEGIGFSLAGYNLSCIADCKANGAASSLFKRSPGLSLGSALRSGDGQPDDVASEAAERNLESDTNEAAASSQSAPWMYTVAVTCKIMKQVSEEILKLIKEDEMRGDAATDESRNQLFLCIVDAIRTCMSSAEYTSPIAC